MTLAAPEMKIQHPIEKSFFTARLSRGPYKDIGIGGFDIALVFCLSPLVCSKSLMREFIQALNNIYMERNNWLFLFCFAYMTDICILSKEKFNAYFVAHAPRKNY